ncbi:unnamed protein product [Boreogadus saida]
MADSDLPLRNDQLAREETLETDRADLEAANGGQTESKLNALLAVPQSSSRKECGSATSRPQRPGSPKKGRSLSSPRADSGQWSRGGG